MCHIMICYSQPWGQVGFFRSKMWPHIHFWWEKWATNWGKNKKKYNRKHPFSDSFREVLQGSFEKRYRFLRRFSSENVRSWPDSEAKPVLHLLHREYFCERTRPDVWKQPWPAQPSKFRVRIHSGFSFIILWRHWIWVELLILSFKYGN